MSETPSPKEPEPPKAVVIPYSRENIKEDNRKAVATSIREENKWADLRKTPEWKVKLSGQWMTRASINEVQKWKIFEKLGLKKDLDLTKKENQEIFSKTVSEWQKWKMKEAWSTIKEADGIIWWATLEALDNDGAFKDAEIAKEEKTSTSPLSSEQQQIPVENAQIANDWRWNLVFPPNVSDRTGVTLNSAIFGNVAVPTNWALPVDNPDTLLTNTAVAWTPSATPTPAASAESKPWNTDKTGEWKNDSEKQDKNDIFSSLSTLLPLVKGSEWNNSIPVILEDAKYIDLNDNMINARTKSEVIKMQDTLKKYPQLWSLTKEKFKKYWKDPDAFLLDSDTDEHSLFRQNWKATDVISGKKELDLNKTLWFWPEWVTYKKEGAVWTKKEWDKISIAQGGKFVTPQEYIENTETASTNGLKKLPGSDLKYQVIIDNITSKKTILFGQEDPNKSWVLLAKWKKIIVDGKETQSS